MAIEEHIKGIITNKIINAEGYLAQDKTSKDGVTWYKEGSYKTLNKTIEKLLNKATKSLTLKDFGVPDFVIDSPNLYIVIEVKGIEKNNKHKHSRFSDVKQYIKPLATNNEIYDSLSIQKREVAIDEILYYATFMNELKDVIAIAVSGGEKDEDFRFTSFLLPKGKTLSSLKLIEDSDISIQFNSIKNYTREIYKALGYEEKLYRSVYEDLRKYVDASAKFFNTNNIDENDRLGLVSAIVLALTNNKSILYKKVSTMSKLEIIPNEIKDALLSETKPFGIIIEDKLPTEKRNILKVYFNNLLDHPILIENVKIKDCKEIYTKEYFDINQGYTNSILSRTTYSLYKYVIELYNIYKESDIDVMGTFYSLFLQYAKADVKKGVVLTPKHITNLFCDLAEYYLQEKLTEKTKILDICTGSGGFLISALRRIDKNIDNDKTKTVNEKKYAKEQARKKCLIGIEKKPIMFVLAYANMRFHKDGQASLYQGSSLINDETILYDNKTFKEIIADSYNEYDQNELSIEDKIKICGPKIGMINPPYEEDVFEFINSMLFYLCTNGIGICIVPIGAQSTNNEITEKKNKILNKHTLLASILMPTDLFSGTRGSGASIATCILIFKAHYPHKDFIENGGLTYLADWSIDGFKLINKRGRFEIDDKWNSIDNGYLSLYLKDLKRQQEEKEYILSSKYKLDIHNKNSEKSIRKQIHKFDHIETIVKYNKNNNATQQIIEKEIYINEDWNIVNYIKTDYEELKNEDFMKNILDYNLYVYMKENNLLFDKE